MSIEFRSAKRTDSSLLILLAGATGTGKTESAMRLATGLARGQRFAGLDTENGRMLHKADDYNFDYAALDPPFTPERYIEAIKAADDQGYPVIVVDSGSHEYDGIGGILDIQAQELERLGGGANVAPLSWNEPKKRDRRYRQALITTHAHVILCLRAEDKIEIINKDGKTTIQPMRTIPGKSIDGYAPICEKRLPFEATISLLLMGDQPGVPRPIKLEARHQPLIPLDQQLDEKVGLALADWAAGGSKPSTAEKRQQTAQAAELEEELLALRDRLGKSEQVKEAVDRARSNPGFGEWLKRQVELAREAVAAKEGSE